MTGYQRHRITRVGAGASERFDPVLESVTMEDDSGVGFGAVLQCFDRSAYLKFDARFNAAAIPGPALVLLGEQSVVGPLTLQVEALPSPNGLVEGITEGDRCRLRTRQRRDVETDEYIITIGESTDLILDAALLMASPDAIPAYGSLTELSPESEVYQRAAALLQWVPTTAFEDGLEWVSSMADSHINHQPEEPWEELAAAWVDSLEATSVRSAPPAIVDILGRGPGATPSGDDVTTGIIITLLALTDGELRTHVQAIGDRVVRAAERRTTSVSTALMAQAVRGRTAPEIRAMLAVLLDPNTNSDRLRDQVATVCQLGHTSGVDILVGILVTILFIAPSYST